MDMTPLNGLTVDEVREVIGGLEKMQQIHRITTTYMTQGGDRSFTFKCPPERVLDKVEVIYDTVKLMENHDYTVDHYKRTITFNHAICRPDSGLMLEIIAYTPTPHNSLKGLVLLPRHYTGGEFSDEQLNDLISDIAGQCFSVSHLLKFEDNTRTLERHEGKSVQVRSAEVTEKGIICVEASVIKDEQR